MLFRTKSSSHYTYLQLVQGFRQGKKVRQRVIATLGRLDQLQASGALDRLLQSGARLSEHSAVLFALLPPDDPGADSRTLGQSLVPPDIPASTTFSFRVVQDIYPNAYALRDRRVYPVSELGPSPFSV